MLKILNFLYDTKEAVRQNKLGQYAYETTTALNNTVRADVSRAVSHLLNDNLVDIARKDRPQKNRYKITTYGAYLIEGIRRRSKRKKNVSS